MSNPPIPTYRAKTDIILKSSPLGNMYDHHKAEIMGSAPKLLVLALIGGNRYLSAKRLFILPIFTSSTDLPHFTFSS